MADRPARTRNTVLTSRNYIHDACGQVTELDGPEFQAVANPLAEIVQTQCSHCDIDDSLTQFRWEDTEETLRDYVERHREDIPDEALERTAHDQVIKFAIRGAVTGGVISAVLGVLIGAATSPLIGCIAGVILVLLGAPLGAVLKFMSFESNVVQPMLEKYLGVQDVGELR